MRPRDLKGRFLPAYLTDIFDPRGWDVPVPWRLVYLDNRAARFALVDRDDWPLVSGSMWRANVDTRGKAYARRSDGKYLHRVLMQDTPPPNEQHCIVDHKNGNGLDCRRINLRWATPEQNALNTFGFFWKQQRLFT